MTSDIIADITGFSLPIFSLEGMKETKRLKNPSLADCMTSGYGYTLLAPHFYEYTQEIYTESSNSVACRAGFPKEWNLS